MLSQLKDHIGMDFALVEESLIEKTERRQKRLRSSLSFLLSEKVLKHALPRIDPETGEWKVSEGHLTNAIVGAAHAKEALMDRLSRLSPRSSGEAILAMVTYMTSPRQWSKLFDMLQLDKALLSLPTTGESDLPSPSVRLPQEAKALVVQSLLGELRILHDSDRSHQVTNEPAVINRLVHHVLASHALDNILSELLHHTLEKVIEEGTPVWRDYQAFEAAEQRRMYRSAPPALHARPSPAPSYNAEGAVRQQIDEDLKAFFEPLHPIDSAQIAVSTSREKEDAMRRVTPSTSSQTRTSQRNHWHEVHRQLLFEHPTPPVDTPHAAFAPPYPRLEKSL